MGEILGHDINGRPLRAGDEVVLVRVRFYRVENIGMHSVIIGRAEDGDIILDDKNPRTGESWEASPENLRKLDNHQPAGSFDEVMAGLRNKEANDERV